MEPCGMLYAEEFSFPYSEVLQWAVYVVQGYILDISNGHFQILICIRGEAISIISFSPQLTKFLRYVDIAGWVKLGKKKKKR